MLLHEVPRHSKIRVLGEAKCPPGHRDFVIGEVLNFHHIDGMYSYCTDSEENIVHLVAWAEVEIVE